MLGDIKTLLAIGILAIIATWRHIYRKIKITLFGDYPRHSIVQCPKEAFEDLEGYTFKHNYTFVSWTDRILRVHYIDEGQRDAPVILCCHGEPSWSYLYRKMVPGLVEAGFRVVCPDFVGFGMSDKFVHHEDYSHALHKHTLETVITTLDLRQITLVCQDWGGLTSLCCVPDLNVRFARLVIMNTGLPPHGRLTFKSKIRFLAWRLMVEALWRDLPIGWLFASACKGLSPGAKRGYQAPFPDARHMGGAVQWPRLVPLNKSSPIAMDMTKAMEHLKTWTKPALVMFSDKDPITRDLPTFFTHLLPTVGYAEGQTAPVTIKGAGHFLQEDKPDELVDNIVRFCHATPIAAQ